MDHLLQHPPTKRDRSLIPSRLSERRLLLVIIVVAVALRLLSALYQGNTVQDLPGIYDQISYHGLAERVAVGYGFSFAEGHWPATRPGEPTAHWSYLYTSWLAAVYWLFGVNPLLARLLQAVLAGIFHPFLTWKIGREVFGSTIGLIAAGLSSIYIYFVYYAGGLITETFYMVGILWVFYAAYKILLESKNQNGGRYRTWVEFGVALGFTVLLRQVFLLFAPLLFLWMWWHLREEPIWQRRPRTIGQWINLPVIGGLAITTAVLIGMVVPWTVRNYLAFNTFVPLNTNSGFAFFWGNHPVHGSRFIPLLGTEAYYELLPAELLHLNEAELDQALMARGLQFVTDDPGRFLTLSISRIPEYFKFWPSSDSSLISNIARVGSFGAALPFILYGLLIAIRIKVGAGAAQQKAMIGLMFLFLTFYTAIHLASWTLIRYRVPLDALLLIFAALAVNTILDKTAADDAD
ncbi:MAG: glycosyltransferase family 39 protein [Ardenticatenaceae bacterium]|nr:glycosyltransferase family 39 protein [Ardenticatenaceae bacterium]